MILGLPVLLWIIVVSPIGAALINYFTAPYDTEGGDNLWGFLNRIMIALATITAILVFFGLFVAPVSIIGTVTASAVATALSIPYMPVALLLSLLP